jgi:excisionase family DNA binding protein
MGIERILVRSRGTRVKYPKETNPMTHTGTPPEVMTLDETARYLRLSKRTVRKLAKQGRLPGREIEGDWRFLKAALENWLRGQDGRATLLEQAGVFADDDTLPELLKGIYAARGRPEVEDGVEP